MDARRNCTAENIQKMLSSPKHMITIFWLPLGFRVIRVLPKRPHFDATYFLDNILDEINCTHLTGNAEDD
jgi:hypothetical protein